jgi:hypothetical protein
MRVQRNRSALLRSPLSRKPLGITARNERVNCPCASLRHTRESDKEEFQ